MAKSIMIQGTMSNVGKSFLTAGLCRVLRQDGWKVAPFKSQNMALNSFITADGLEIGRAQAVQAEACGIEPTADMNPILLKPSSDVGSQVIVRGTPIGTMPAKEYFAYKKKLIPQILESYRRLDEEYDIIVIEGAGSPAEINLAQDDIVNMGIAEMTDSPVILAGDIDRGGVFAQLYGTVMLLPESQRKRIRGLVINKFRGDRSILDPGTEMISKLCGIPVVGTVPFLKADIDDEDSLSTRLTAKGKPAAPGEIDIAVIRLPRLSNFTDLHVFETVGLCNVRYVTNVKELGTPDLLVLPGTKNTIDDLLWLRTNGLESAILKLAAAEVPVFGICGGYQMMGEVLSDPEGHESGQPGRVLRGMGLIPAETVFTGEKIRSQNKGEAVASEGLFAALRGKQVRGYQIHMGRTTVRGGKPLLKLRKALLPEPEGYASGWIAGTYLHGIFDGPGVAAGIAELLRKRKMPGADAAQVTGIMDPADAADYEDYRRRQYDILADGVRRNLDMEKIYQIIDRRDLSGG